MFRFRRNSGAGVLRQNYFGSLVSSTARQKREKMVDGKHLAEKPLIGLFQLAQHVRLCLRGVRIFL